MAILLMLTKMIVIVLVTMMRMIMNNNDNVDNANKNNSNTNKMMMMLALMLLIIIMMLATVLHSLDIHLMLAPRFPFHCHPGLGSKCSKSCENAWEVLHKWHMTRYAKLSSFIFHLGAILGHLGAFLGQLRPYWVHLGVILGCQEPAGVTRNSDFATMLIFPMQFDGFCLVQGSS